MASDYGVSERFKSRVSDKNRGETFAESDISLTHKGTEVVSESIETAADNWRGTNPTFDSLTSQRRGTAFTMERGGTVSAQLWSSLGTDVSTAYLINVDTDTVIDSVAASGGDTVSFTHSFDSTVTYGVTVDDNGADYEPYSYADPFPFEQGSLTITGGVKGTTFDSAEWHNIVDITGEKAASIGGEVYVTWTQPSTVFRWDAATFQHTLEGESVDVYLEENDGSGWVEIAGPIQRGQDITAAPDSQCRFRVEISRTDTANNPRLDSIHRRWVV